MKAEKIEITLNKVGTTALETPIKGEVLIPLADKESDWPRVFASWPKAKGLMEKVTIHDAIVEGLRTLARRQKTSELIKEYRAANGGNRKRGRGSEREVVDIKS